LCAVEREAVADDSELFAMYGPLAAEHSAAAADHVADLHDTEDQQRGSASSGKKNRIVGQRWIRCGG
jgi:hypothetical protein